MFSERGSCVITGRSDATLNRGGVRLGTGEFYRGRRGAAGGRRLARRPPRGRRAAAAASCCCSSYRPPASRSTTRCARGSRRRCARSSRRGTSPTEIVGVTAIPRTLTGKKLETPVKRILRGEPPDRSRAAARSPTRGARRVRRGWRWSSGPTGHYDGGRRNATVDGTDAEQEVRGMQRGSSPCGCTDGQGRPARALSVRGSTNAAGSTPGRRSWPKRTSRSTSERRPRRRPPSPARVTRRAVDDLMLVDCACLTVPSATRRAR